MNNKKGTWTSKYDDADAAFVYDYFCTYTHDDFAQLSFTHLLRISKTLQVQSAKQYLKTALTNVIIQKHTDQVREESSRNEHTNVVSNNETKKEVNNETRNKQLLLVHHG